MNSQWRIVNDFPAMALTLALGWGWLFACTCYDQIDQYLNMHWSDKFCCIPELPQLGIKLMSSSASSSNASAWFDNKSCVTICNAYHMCTCMGTGTHGHIHTARNCSLPHLCWFYKSPGLLEVQVVYCLSECVRVHRCQFLGSSDTCWYQLSSSALNQARIMHHK